jgi:hypothetical protein
MFNGLRRNYGKFPASLQDELPILLRYQELPSLTNVRCLSEGVKKSKIPKICFRKYLITNQLIPAFLTLPQFFHTLSAAREN